MCLKNLDSFSWLKYNSGHLFSFGRLQENTRNMEYIQTHSGPNDNASLIKRVIRASQANTK